jgi:hypothetical protein
MLAGTAAAGLVCVFMALVSSGYAQAGGILGECRGPS